MFLDDELKQIVEETPDQKQRDEQIFEAVRARVKELAGTSGEAYRNGLKRIDASWRLFTKTHTYYNPEWFQKYILGLLTLNDK